MTDFNKVLARLTIAVDEAGTRRHVIEVETRDLWELLREHARLDADARLTYGPHVERARKAVEALRDTARDLDEALHYMPSRDELLARMNAEIKGPR